MKSTGAGPSVGAAKNGFIAMLLAHSIEFGGSDFERFIPGQFDEFVDAATIAASKVRFPVRDEMFAMKASG